MKKLLFILWVSVCSVCNAQDMLTPSEKSFEHKWVSNKSYEMIWYLVKDSAQIKIGSVKTQITIDKKILQVVTRVDIDNVKTPWLDTTIAEVKTLSPLKHSSYNGQRDMELHFGKVITGFYKDNIKKDNTRINDTTVSKFFDSNLYPNIITWLPLKAGYTRDIAIYDYNPERNSGVMKASVTDVREGTFHSEKKGKRAIWEVTVIDEISKESKSIYWIDKIDRTLWCQYITAGPRQFKMQRVE